MVIIMTSIISIIVMVVVCILLGREALEMRRDRKELEQWNRERAAILWEQAQGYRKSNPELYRRVMRDVEEVERG